MFEWESRMFTLNRAVWVTLAFLVLGLWSWGNFAFYSCFRLLGWVIVWVFRAKRKKREGHVFYCVEFALEGVGHHL